MLRIKGVKMLKFYDKFVIQPQSGSTPTPTPTSIYSADEKITGYVIDSVTYTEAGE